MSVIYKLVILILIFSVERGYTFEETQRSQAQSPGQISLALSANSVEWTPVIEAFKYPPSTWGSSPQGPSFSCPSITDHGREDFLGMSWCLKLNRHNALRCGTTLPRSTLSPPTTMWQLTDTENDFLQKLRAKGPRRRLGRERRRSWTKSHERSQVHQDSGAQARLNTEGEEESEAARTKHASTRSTLERRRYPNHASTGFKSRSSTPRTHHGAQETGQYIDHWSTTDGCRCSDSVSSNCSKHAERSGNARTGPKDPEKLQGSPAGLEQSIARWKEFATDFTERDQMLEEKVQKTKEALQAARERVDVTKEALTNWMTRRFLRGAGDLGCRRRHGDRQQDRLIRSHQSKSDLPIW